MTNHQRPTTRAVCLVLVLAFASFTFVSTVQAADESGNPRVAAGAPASAATGGPEGAKPKAPVDVNAGETAAPSVAAENAAPAIVPMPPRPSPGTRPLVPLYVSYAALQALDVHSTLHAIKAGGAEGNLIMAPFVSRPAAFVALKAGATAGIIYSSQRLAKRSRVGAFALMIAANTAYALIVAHNYRVAGQLK